MKQSSPIVLIMAGGTGGHVFPALATADILREQGCEVQWLGTAAGIESRVVPQAGIKLNTISIQGLRRKGKLSLLMAPLKLVRALFQAISVIRRIQPDVVLGMGGFASGPGALAAWILRKALVIHEQNAIAGLTNTQSRRFAKRVLQAFPRAFKSGEQGEVVGNPIRGPILALDPPATRFAGRTGPLRVLVVGGSLGALVINQRIPEAISQLSKTVDIEVWHQTGKPHFDQTRALYQQFGFDAKVAPFIEQMDEAYAWADLVICRAGALTVSELAIAGLAALFVPFPFAVDDHQTANARFLEQAGAAEIIDQSSLTTERLVVWISEHQSRKTLLDMAEKARALGRPDSGVRVAQICLEVCQ